MPALITVITKVAGLPHGVADSYTRHMAGVRVVNALSGAADQPYLKKFIIPQ